MSYNSCKGLHATSPCNSTRLRFAYLLAMDLPLPKGEGRGEGEEGVRTAAGRGINTNCPSHLIARAAWPNNWSVPVLGRSRPRPAQHAGRFRAPGACGHRCVRGRAPSAPVTFGRTRQMRQLIACVASFCALVAACGFLVQAGPLPADWQHQQRFEVSVPDLVKLSLPLATLDAARPALEDLRLYDDAGREVPYLIERPRPAPKVVQDAKSFQVSVNAATTVLTLETGLAQPLDGVTLDSPARSFIKAVMIEGSADGQSWQPLARGQPIFRQPGGASHLHLAVPVGVWPWLRLTVDDQRSQPIPFTGARVHAAAVEPVPAEGVPVTLTGRDEKPGESRLALNLGAANLDVASVTIETTEPLFTREVTLAVPQVVDGTVREQTLRQAVIYRVAVEGQPASSSLTLPLETSVHSRELLLRIKNKDSPLLPITAVRAERRPVYLVFLARSAGAHYLLSGNSRCGAPSYDLAALGANLRAVAVSAVKVSPLADNPNYRPPEVLAGIQEGGTVLNVSAWKYRKAVNVDRAGAQRIELDLDVLSHSQPDFADLRLVRDGQQLAYILEPTSISRSLTPTVTTASDKKDLQITRWIIKLARPNLPISRLSCTARTPVFQRNVTLYEELTDERGDKYRRTLGGAGWVQTLARTNQEFTLAFEGSPRRDTLILETHNGDNPPIELEKFQAFYSATRILFKARPADEPLLYYGNPQVDSPRYDLSLVAGQLLAADQASPTLGAEEQLKKSWSEGHCAGKGGIVFWGILVVVVVVLLIIISRLLPHSSRPE
jgi:hypothetical protein